MALKGAIARRYAEAVFDLGKEHNSVDRWRDDITVINEYIGNRALLFVLSEPKVAFAKKQGILEDLFANRIQRDALGLVIVLTERQLLDILPRLTMEFERLYDDYKNQAKATLTTALPLDADEQAQIVASLQRLTGKTVQLTTNVDASILGGVVARVGDTLIDGSVARRLAILREQIATGVLPAAATS